jgi:hypothetical protein
LKNKILGLASFCLATSLKSSEPVTWGEQANRLQAISSALLESPSFARKSPLEKGFSFYAQIDGTAIPSVNSIIGSKTEDLPQPPGHALPFFGVAWKGGQDTVGLHFESSLGYLNTAWLPIDVGASLKQLTQHAGFSISHEIKKAQALFLRMDITKTEAFAKARVADEGFEDEFLTKAYLLGLSGLFQTKSWTWGLGAGIKKSQTSILVSIDQTLLHYTDQLQDAPLPFWIALSMEKQINPSLSLIFQELWQPERLLVPRLSVRYSL